MGMNGKNGRFIWAFLALLLFTVLSCSKPSGDTESRRSKPVRFGQKERLLLREKTAMLDTTVNIKFFRRSAEEKHYAKTRALLDLLSTMTSRIKVQELGLSDPGDRQKLETDHGPVLIPEGEIPIGISYYGFPNKMELEPFLDSLLIATGQMKPLADTTVSYLKSLDADVNIRVFVTPL